MDVLRRPDTFFYVLEHLLRSSYTYFYASLSTHPLTFLSLILSFLEFVKYVNLQPSNADLVTNPNQDGHLVSLVSVFGSLFLLSTNRWGLFHGGTLISSNVWFSTHKRRNQRSLKGARLFS